MSSFLRNDLTIIPIDNTTMLTTTPARDPEKKRDATLSRFIREYICKVAECIASARRVCPRSSHNAMHTGLSESWSDLHTTTISSQQAQAQSQPPQPSQPQWFRIEVGKLMGDAQPLRRYIETECMANWDAAYRDFTLTMDISLSAESLSTHVLLERWRIKFKREAAHCVGDTAEMNDPALIYKRMSIQMRSIVSYLRLLPTHAIVQSWESAMAAQSMLHLPSSSTTTTTPVAAFALYHLIYSPHNRQHADVNNFVGDTKSFSFAPIKSKFGTLRTTVFYGEHIGTEFAWLIRSAPGRNPPLTNDNLSAHIDGNSRYWDKKQARKDRNKLSKHYHRHHPQHQPQPPPPQPRKQSSSPQTPFELIAAAPTSSTTDERDENGSMSAKAFMLDAQMSSPNNTSSSPPPMKCLSSAFHESPVLHASTPKLDPHKEMEKIRLSTIFGSAPPVISLADISSNANEFTTTTATMATMSGSQLLHSIVREKQIMATRKYSSHSGNSSAPQLLVPVSKTTIMKTLSDIEASNASAHALATSSDASSSVGDSSDMNCDESDRSDIQNEIFQGYDDDKDEGDGGDAQVDCPKQTQRQIAKLSEFINLCKTAQKQEFASFKTMDALLLVSGNERESDINMKDQSQSQKYFQLLSQHFEARQQRLMKLKKTSTAVLSSSVMKK
mmetsp:Transcript_12678/g.19205  ORF Transcript_12678/g.19205 Transcript_12678/m.19205 type:complete len:670 (+) Transcript_12678:32-2041(+)